MSLALSVDLTDMHHELRNGSYPQTALSKLLGRLHVKDFPRSQTSAFIQLLSERDIAAYPLERSYNMIEIGIFPGSTDLAVGMCGLALTKYI